MPKKTTVTTTIDPVTAGGTVRGAKRDESQERLRALIERRHPLYKSLSKHWSFMEKTYDGGRDWFTENIFRYIKEGDQEFNGRLSRAYRFNHTREVVDLINKYLFKQHIARSEDVPESVKRFWDKSTKAV